MRIQRDKLMLLLGREIGRLETEEAQRAQRERDREEKRLAVYLEETLPHWRAFGNRIRRLVSNGQPVTLEDAPPELRFRHAESLRWWRPSREVEERPTATDLRALLHVLELAEDEYVTTTALERQGFALGRALRGIS